MVSKTTGKLASEKEEVALRDYELVVVISPEVGDEEEVETKIEGIQKLITDKGGELSSVDKWGKRKLAYPIRHFTEGHYVLVKFKAKPALGKQLEASLEISEDVLRYLVVKSEG
jgi:small subunit ribosomal protein S6